MLATLLALILAGIEATAFMAWEGGFYNGLQLTGVTFVVLMCSAIIGFLHFRGGVRKRT